MMDRISTFILLATNTMKPSFSILITTQTLFAFLSLPCLFLVPKIEVTLVLTSRILVFNIPADVKIYATLRHSNMIFNFASMS